MLPGLLGIHRNSRIVSGGLASSGASATAATSHTFSNYSIGAEPTGGDTRLIIVCVGLLATDLSSITVGGSTPTLLVGPISHSSQTFARIYGIEIGSGTTATVAITTSAPSTGGIAIYRAINASITPHATASDTANILNMSLDTAPNGYAIAMSINRNRISSSWSGITEDVDFEGGSNDYFSSASDATIGSTLSIACNAPTNGNESSGAAVALKAA